MTDQEKRLFEEAVTEIKSLRRENEIKTARLDVYDEMMRLFHSEAKYKAHGLMHPDIVYDIEKQLASIKPVSQQ